MTARPADEAPASERLPPGRILGGTYALRGELGHGPVSTTYAAIAAPGRDVAVRVIGPGLADVEAAIDEARRIEEATRELPERAIGHVVDDGRDDDGARYLVSALSQHPSLAQLVEVCPFEPREAVLVLGHLVAAVEALHEAGVAHLGLKPTNVFVGPTPELPVQVVDAAAYRLRRAGGESAIRASLPWASTL